MGRYIGTTELRAYLSPDDTLGTSQNALLDSCITRAEAAIDHYTRRSFATVQDTKYYSRHVARIVGQALYLPEDLYQAGTVISGNGQNIPIGSIWFEPRNLGPPYRVVRLYSMFVWTFNTDGEIRITGGWGYSGTAPADIVQATVRTAAYLYRGKDSGFGAVDATGFTDGGEAAFAKSIPDDVRWTLSPYRSRTGGVV